MRVELPPEGRGVPRRGPSPSGPRRHLQLLSHAGLILALLHGGPGGALGGEARPGLDWVGKRVVIPASRTPIRLDGRIIAVLNAGSEFRVGRVAANGLWLDEGNLQGWVALDDVLLLDEAIERFDGEIRRHPDDPDPWIRRGVVLVALKRFEQAEKDLSQAIALDPNHAWAHGNRSVARHALRQTRGALEDAREAVRLDPNEPAHLANRAAARFALGEFAEAAADYTRALGLLKGGEASIGESITLGASPRHRARLWAVQWTCARAECWEALRSSEKAIVDLAEALRLDPQDVTTLNSLAWTLATARDSRVRDGRRAFEIAARACDLTGYRNHASLGTLAAAFAELGDRSGAIRWLRRAAELAVNDGENATEYHDRLTRLEGNPAPR